jgi:nucleosome binding factor SPN SPT16 subunit
VEICYSPVVQSGGKYDIRVSAESNTDNLSPDVIICSLGARYKSYCANMSRTFLVDAPPVIEQTYATLLSMYNVCLEAMLVGNELKDVYAAANDYLTKKNPALIAYMPKTLGFSIGIEFRDGTLVLNQSNGSKFAEDMIFNLAVGFHNVPLSAEDKTGTTSTAVKKLPTFSLLLADTVRVLKDGAPEILTKFTKEYSDISYNISEKADGEKDMDVDEDEAEEGGAAGKETRAKRVREQHANESAASDRMRLQREIIEKRLEEARRRSSNGKVGKDEDEVVSVEAKDLKLYNSPSEYPRDIVPNQVKIDMEKEAIFIPINGQAVPFHISVIKNIVLPGDVKNVSYLRINFYTPGGALAKDVPKNTQLLVAKYGSMMPFLKEITLRSLNPRHFSNIHVQYQELRKRVRQREQRAEQEKDLVTQAKLIKIKDQRIPRLQDVRLFPPLSGQKCIGTIEAHQNGLRFTSNKGDSLDVLYSNIKHAIYQPCDKTTIVLLHFHLKDFIMIGKKKQKDVQFYTEVIDASLNLDNARRYSHDVDELDEEQRDREMRKRLNLAFKEFSAKLQKVAEHYDYNLIMDVPYKKVGFYGNPNREMVYIQPTAHCIVNLTEKPAFIISLSDVEHVHFERVTFGTRNFDLTFIFKNWDVKPRTIASIDIKSKEVIQDWLNLVEIPHTIGTRTINWVEIMNIARQTGARFYENYDEDGIKKPAGWTFLSAEGDTDDEGEEGEEEDEDSEFSGGDEDSDDDDDDSEDESSFDEEDDDDDDDEEEDDEVRKATYIKHTCNPVFDVHAPGLTLG